MSVETVNKIIIIIGIMLMLTSFFCFRLAHLEGIRFQKYRYFRTYITMREFLGIDGMLISKAEGRK